MSLRAENEGYSLMNTASSFGEDTSSFREELSLAQRLNLQVIQLQFLRVCLQNE